MHLDWTSIGFVNQAIRDSNILRLATTKTEHGPARRERTVRYSHGLATSEQSACIVLAFDRAITDVHMLSADEVKTVVIAIDPIVDVNASQIHIAGLNNPD